VDPVPSPARFAALARSSPWRWWSVRFTVSWTGAVLVGAEPVRAWVRRPDDLRVEALDGRLRAAGTFAPAATSVGFLHAVGPGPPPPRPPAPPPWAGEVAPVFDADGTVAARPGPDAARYDDPMYRDYRWVAMLDPVELADGVGREIGRPGRGPVLVDDVRAVEHGGRPAWEAVLRPTWRYDPRCSCCPLLFGAVSEGWEEQGGAVPAHLRDPRLVYPAAHRVRLDLGTGICVLTEEMDGSRAGSGHDLRVEAVDVPFPDDLFRPTRARRRLLRGRGGKP
jgi:hypothetical protein